MFSVAPSCLLRFFLLRTGLLVIKVCDFLFRKGVLKTLCMVLLVYGTLCALLTLRWLMAKKHQN